MGHDLLPAGRCTTPDRFSTLDHGTSGVPILPTADVRRFEPALSVDQVPVCRTEGQASPSRIGYHRNTYRGLSSTTLYLPAMGDRLGVPRRAVGGLRGVHGWVFRTQPQRHANGPKNRANRLLHSPSHDEQKYHGSYPVGQSRARSGLWRLELPGRTPPVPLDAAPKPARSVANRAQVLC